ncbi:MAG: PD-(D/E)XK motif protein [Chryseobacterium sp.]|nr:MAG: PD-(D/E)XK motif protein [Chryseobacterium sp.]
MSYGVDVVWSNQLASRGGYSELVLEDISSVRCVVASNSISDTRILMIGFDREFDWDGASFRQFRNVEMQVLHESGRVNLVFMLMDRNLAGIFTLFVEDLLGTVASLDDQQDVWNASLEIVGLWKRMFESVARHGLSPQQQQGLYGELFFMDYALDKGVDMAAVLFGWQGPDAMNQDFIVGDLAVEVKTSIANNPALHISNELQLSMANLSALYIFFLELQERPQRQGVTLNAMVDSLRGKFAGSLPNLNLFEEKLIRAGYHQEHYNSYASRSYLLRNLTVFNVSPGFPALVAEHLPSGIHNVNYRIERSACDGFEIEEEFLFDLIN